MGGEEDGGELERPVDMIAKGTTASGLENENGEIDRLWREHETPDESLR